METNTATSNPVPLSPKRKFLQVLLYSSLGVTGVLVALLLLIRDVDSVWKGFASAGSLILMDMFIVVGLFAGHKWLQRIIWIISPICFLFSLGNIWFYGNLPTFLKEVTLALFVLSWVSLLVGLMSLLWKHIKDTAVISKFYMVSLSVMSFAGFCYALEAGWGFFGTDDYDAFSFLQVINALTVIAATGIAITLFGSAFHKKAQKEQQKTLEAAEKASQEQNELESMRALLNSPEARTAWLSFMAEYQDSKNLKT